MKNATKHADSLKALYKRLLKEHKPDARESLEPLKALVKGAMSYDVSDARAAEAMKAIDKEFVDLNELRVATDLEIQELLGQRYPAIEERVAMITQCLNAIFEREQTMSLNRLKEISKRDARQFLRELPTINPFVEAYITLFGCDGNAIPVDNEIFNYLREQGILDDTVSIEEAQKFLEHHLKADECHSFFAVVRSAAHAGGGKGRKKAKV